MDLVINTQYRENYGSVKTPYWKNKGGDTYVVKNLSEKSANRIKENGIPVLEELLNCTHPMMTTHVIGHQIVDSYVHDGDDAPVLLSYVDGRWTAEQITENTEFSGLRADIARKVVTWTLAKGDVHENADTRYLMKDGSVLDYNGNPI